MSSNQQSPKSSATDSSIYEDNVAIMAGYTGINLETRPDLFQEESPPNEES